LNGKEQINIKKRKGYIELSKRWKKGDCLKLTLPMPVRLMEANHLVEEARNQVAVMRGPIVYCIESPDLNGKRIHEILLPANIELKPIKETISGSVITMLEGVALSKSEDKWDKDLYRPLNVERDYENIEVKLLPYFAWGNRGKSEMSVWIPLKR